MAVTEWALVVVAVLVLVTLVLWRLAVRVDRLHRTVLRSRVTLEAQLAARAAAATDLAISGALDPVEALLVSDVALRARDAAAESLVADRLEGSADTDPLLVEAGEEGGPPVAAAAPPEHGPAGPAERALLESELSATLRTVLGDGQERSDLAADPRAGETLGRLDQAWYRLQLARRFHNTRVEQVRHLRANPLVRAFRLAGHAPLPEPFDMDDARPGR